MKSKPKVNTKKSTNKRKRPSNDVEDREHSQQEEDQGQNLFDLETPTIPLTAQTARATTECTECRKPRVVYAKSKLTERQQTQLLLLLSSFDYTCGSPVTPPEHNLSKVVCIRTNITCASSVEVPYYSAALWRNDICCHCANGEAETDTAITKTRNGESGKGIGERGTGNEERKNPEY